jgi:hypothetical protein
MLRVEEPTMRTLLRVLHVLGWVAFVPFVFWTCLLFFLGLIEFAAGRMRPGSDWTEVLVGGAVMLAGCAAGWLTVIATRAALRRLKERERSTPGFEPVMNREQ